MKKIFIIIIGLFCFANYVETKKPILNNFSNNINIFDAINKKDCVAVLAWGKKNRNSTIRTKHYQTPLMIAVKTEDQCIINCLLKYGNKTINAIDSDGKTALDYAIELYTKNTNNGSIETKEMICKQLVRKKAKTSNKEYSEIIRTIMHPINYSKKCAILVIKTRLSSIDDKLCMESAWQSSNAVQYTQSYVLTVQELTREAKIRDNAQKIQGCVMSPALEQTKQECYAPKQISIKNTINKRLQLKNDTVKSSCKFFNQPKIPHCTIL